MEALCNSCIKIIYPNHFCSVREKWINKGYQHCKDFIDEDFGFNEKELKEFIAGERDYPAFQSSASKVKRNGI